MSDLGNLSAALEGVPYAEEVGVPGLSMLRADNLSQEQVDQIAALVRHARATGSAEKAVLMRSPLHERLLYLSRQLQQGGDPQVAAAVLEWLAEDLAKDTA